MTQLSINTTQNVNINFKYNFLPISYYNEDKYIEKFSENNIINQYLELIIENRV